jgi:hypothetical protein
LQKAKLPQTLFIYLGAYSGFGVSCVVGLASVDGAGAGEGVSEAGFRKAMLLLAFSQLPERR